MSELRAGEIALPLDPAGQATDAAVVFIGRVLSPWTNRQTCPKNAAAARETGKPARIVVDPPYRLGLAGLCGYSHVAILTWLHQSRRDLILQKPAHSTEPKGVFALRSPVRPNPIGLHIVRLTAVDVDNGNLELEAIDALDRTPVIDIKPYFASTDAYPDAARPGRGT